MLVYLSKGTKIQLTSACHQIRKIWMSWKKHMNKNPFNRCFCWFEHSLTNEFKGFFSRGQIHTDQIDDLCWWSGWNDVSYRFIQEVTLEVPCFFKASWFFEEHGGFREGSSFESICWLFFFLESWMLEDCFKSGAGLFMLPCWNDLGIKGLWPTKAGCNSIMITPRF